MGPTPSQLCTEEGSDEDSKMRMSILSGVKDCIARHDSSLKAAMGNLPECDASTSSSDGSDESDASSESGSVDERDVESSSESFEVEDRIKDEVSSLAPDAAESSITTQNGSSELENQLNGDVSMDERPRFPVYTAGVASSGSYAAATSATETPVPLPVFARAPPSAQNSASKTSATTVQEVISECALSQAESESRWRKRTCDVRDDTDATLASSSSSSKKKTKISKTVSKEAKSAPAWLLYARSRSNGNLNSGSSAQSLTAEPSPIPTQESIQAARPNLVYSAESALHDTEDGRSYLQFIDGNGYVKPTHGVPLPTGYKCRTGTAVPVHCPVVGCDKSFKSFHGLSGHFSVLHREQAFSDNCDGTFNIVGTFERHPAGPLGIVVNRRKRDAPATTRLHDKDKGKHSKKNAKASYPPQTTILGKTFRSEVLNHVQTSLGRAAKVPDISAVYKMAGMRRRRSLGEDWVNLFSKSEITPLQYAYSVVYLTGNAVGAEKRCKRRQVKESILPEHVAVPQDLTSEELDSLGPYKGCASCLLDSAIKKKQVDCSWKGYVPKASDNTVPKAAQPVAAAAPSSKSLDKSERSIVSGDTVPVASERKEMNAGHIATPNGDTVVVRPSSAASANEVQSAKKQPKNATKNPEQVKTTKRTKKNKQTTTIPTPSHSEESHDDPDAQTPMVDSSKSSNAQAQSQVQSNRSTRSQSDTHHQRGFSPELGNEPLPGQEDEDEMETWEKAPGRILDKAQANVAFSNTYITGHTPVSVAPDLAVNVLNIAPGEYYRWPESASKMRVCFVSSGKVKARLDSTEFRVGRNGVFTVSPNQSCVVENRLYTDAVIHCTTIDNYELLPRAE